MATNHGAVEGAPKTYKSYANGFMALAETTFDAKKKQNFFEGIVYQDSTDNYEDRIVEVGRDSGFAVWNDGEAAKKSYLKEGYAQTFVQVPFGQEFSLGRLFKKFQPREARILERASKGLATDAYLLTQKSMASLLSYGFADTNSYLTGITGTTVSALGPDGKRLFSVVHPCSPDNSTTWSNASGTNAALSGPALEVSLESLDAQLDESGQRKHYGTLSGEGYILIVPRALQKLAVELTESELMPYSADNTINVYRGQRNGFNIEVRVVPFLDEVSTTAWFVFAKEAYDEMGLVLLESQAFSTDANDDQSTKTALVRA